MTFNVSFFIFSVLCVCDFVRHSFTQVTHFLLLRVESKTKLLRVSSSVYHGSSNGLGDKETIQYTLYTGIVIIERKIPVVILSFVFNIPWNFCVFVRYLRIIIVTNKFQWNSPTIPFLLDSRIRTLVVNQRKVSYLSDDVLDVREIPPCRPLLVRFNYKIGTWSYEFSWYFSILYLSQTWDRLLRRMGWRVVSIGFLRDGVPFGSLYHVPSGNSNIVDEKVLQWTLERCKDFLIKKENKEKRKIENLTNIRPTRFDPGPSLQLVEVKRLLTTKSTQNSWCVGSVV